MERILGTTRYKYLLEPVTSHERRNHLLTPKIKNPNSTRPAEEFLQMSTMAALVGVALIKRRKTIITREITSISPLDSLLNTAETIHDQNGTIQH